MDIYNMNLESRQSFRKKVMNDRLKFYLTPNDHSHEIFADSVKTGLTSKRKFLLPQYFYDEKGSKLFEQICEQPEYYLTRVETSILESCADEVAEMCEETLVELGSGNAKKSRIIMDSILERQGSLHYLPIDISYEMLEKSSESLLNRYENLSVTGVVAEYDKGMTVVKKEHPKKLILFLGSSLGNFDPTDVLGFMHMIRKHMQDEDMFLIGLDMHKNSQILNAAYNDVRGVTAQFNLNILARINRELDGDFNLDKFEHKAFYNEPKGRVEMHLVSKVEQEVNIEGVEETISFARGESIHTENSYKFTLEQIERMIEGNFRIVQIWSDKKEWYNVLMLAPI